MPLDGTDKAAASLHRHRAELHHPNACSRGRATATRSSSPMPAKRSAITTSATRPIPRISHALTLEVDDFGNVLKSAAIGYGRRQPDRDAVSRDDQAKQTPDCSSPTPRTASPTRSRLTDDYRTPLPCEARTYELTGLTLPAGRADRFTLGLKMLDCRQSAPAPIDYEQSPDRGACCRSG